MNSSDLIYFSISDSQCFSLELGALEEGSTGILQRHCVCGSRALLAKQYCSTASPNLPAGGGSGLQFVKNATAVKCNKRGLPVHIY